MNQTAEFNDFSGGMTDNIVDCPPNRYELAENFFTTKNNNLEMRSGSARDNILASQVNGINKRINRLVPFGADLLKQHSLDIDVVIANAMVTLLGPTGNSLFAGGNSQSVVPFSTWNQHVYLTNDSLATLPQKIYHDDSGSSNDFQIRNAGLPTIGAPTIISVGGSGPDVEYLYRFLFRDNYTRNGGVIFEVLGPTTEVSVTGKSIQTVATNEITDIPVLSNGGENNYNTAGITVEIYRTIENGTNFFFVDRVTNGTTTYNDETTDDTLVTHAPLYTEGGVFDNDPPPVSKYLHVTERAAYYANILDTGEQLSNEVRQSRPGIVEAVPASFSVQVDGEIVGLSSVRSVPVIFCKTAIYRIDGIIDDFGQGQMIAVKISDKIGCAGHTSIVQTIDALYFAGSNGFYATDGYKVTPISTALQTTYASLVQTDTQRSAICGDYDAIQRRIWWGCNPMNNLDNDSVFVLDLDQPIGQDEQASFTILTGRRIDNLGNELTTNWFATSVAFFNTRMYRSDPSGYTFIHDQTLFSDERYTGTEWIQQAIMYDFKSGVSGLGAPSLRKWLPMIIVNAEPTSNVTCLIESANNKTKTFVPLKAIYEKPFHQWGDSYWGDPTLWTDSSNMIRQRRYFPAGNLWVFYKQIRLRNSFAIITSSDVRGRAGIAGTTTKTISLVGLNVFPPQCIDYYIQILKPDETWSDELLVLTQPIANTLTFDDPGNVAPSGLDLAWRIKGYFKGDGLRLTSYALLFDSLTPTQKGDQSSGDATT